MRFLADLVRTPSFSSKEKEVIAVIKKEMKKVGFDEVRIDGLGNIIGRIGNGPRVIAFDAHVDTVYPGDLAQWNFDPFQPKVEDGKVWGRGTVDQKGGMAAMVHAGKIIKELGLNDQFTIYFTGTVMEEDCDGLCWQYLLKEEKLKPELVVITEPTNLNIYRGHRGRMEIRVEVKGRSCHGSAPERGDNAIYKIARIALEIEKLNERLRERPVPRQGHGHRYRGALVVALALRRGRRGRHSPGPPAHRRRDQGERRRRGAGRRASAPAIPTPKSSCSNMPRPPTPAKCIRRRSIIPTWVLEEESPWLKNAVGRLRRRVGQGPAGGQVDLQHQRRRHRRHAGHSLPRAWARATKSMPTPRTRRARSSTSSRAAAFYAALVARTERKGLKLVSMPGLFPLTPALSLGERGGW